MPARRRKPSFDVSTARRAGPIVIASSPAHTTAPPATVATATRPASLCHPRSCRASDHAATAASTSAPIRKNWGCVRPPPPNAIAACHDTPARADGQAHRGRDERRGEREVRQVARGEVHREQPGEEPGEHPRRPSPAAFAGHGARGTDEHGRPHADRGAERRLEGGGDGRHGQVCRAGEDRQERGAARPSHRRARVPVTRPPVSTTGRRGCRGRRRTGTRAGRTARAARARTTSVNPPSHARSVPVRDVPLRSVGYPVALNVP